MDFTSQCTFWCSVLSDNSMESFVVPVESSQCTFWCSVLSDEVDGKVYVWRPKGSQCTFWCSVLSDLRGDDSRFVLFGLNAPSGAQCFPTRRVYATGLGPEMSQCTFWCSVLSDADGDELIQDVHAVSMHLLVLSAFRLADGGDR